MASIPDDPKSPKLANLVVLLGFVLGFTTFVTDSPWSLIIGTIMVVGGGLWAGWETSHEPAG